MIPYARTIKKGIKYCNPSRTCANKSPRAQPTNDVIALVMSGFLSKASLYAAQPGTAPPRIFCTSRNSGLVDALVKAVVGGVVNSEAGLVATLVRVDGLTPNARTVKKDDAMMKSDESFMMRGEIVSLLDENVAE